MLADPGAYCVSHSKNGVAFGRNKRPWQPPPLHPTSPPLSLQLYPPWMRTVPFVAINMLADPGAWGVSHNSNTPPCPPPPAPRLPSLLNPPWMRTVPLAAMNMLDDPGAWCVSHNKN